MLPRTFCRLHTVLKHVRFMCTAGTENEVLFNRIGSAGVITLNRPKALNSLNLPMVRKIYPQMVKWEEEPDLSFVIIKGTGDKAFCAGGDILAVTEAGKRGDPYFENFFREEYILNNKIGTYKKPYVALIDGITMGGGVGLSVHGTFRVATERTLFAMPETAIALIPDVGGGYFLPRLRGKLGIYLALTGFRLKGIDIQKAGVATHFVESSQINELESALTELKKPSMKDISGVLESFHQKSPGIEKDFVLEPHMEKINRLFSGNTMEDIFRDLEKDGSKWALKQLGTLQKMSPTSMKITLKLLQDGGARTLQEDLRYEYRLTYHCCFDKDLYEGVRAVLVDRDQKPKWQPATIQEVTDEKVNWYFSPLSEDKELIL